MIFALNIFAYLFAFGGLFLILSSRTLTRHQMMGDTPTPATLLVRFKKARDGVILALVGVAFSLGMHILENSPGHATIYLLAGWLLWALLGSWNNRIDKLEDMSNF